MNWMVKYQANDGLREVYFETLDEAVEWQAKFNGAELWERKYS